MSQAKRCNGRVYFDRNPKDHNEPLQRITNKFELGVQTIL
uniref:Uncharacterized protein n=1 Tax=Rhizophora mucronata TaxID=61149 RepID=A0A2P2N6G0_RHIMU